MKSTMQLIHEINERAKQTPVKSISRYKYERAIAKPVALDNDSPFRGNERVLSTIGSHDSGSFYYIARGNVDLYTYNFKMLGEDEIEAIGTLLPTSVRITDAISDEDNVIIYALAKKKGTWCCLDVYLKSELNEALRLNIGWVDELLLVPTSKVILHTCGGTRVLGVNAYNKLVNETVHFYRIPVMVSPNIKNSLNNIWFQPML